MREIPYITRPSLKIIQLLDLALESTFYVLSEPGPTSFILADETQNYRVNIGRRMT